MKILNLIGVGAGTNLLFFFIAFGVTKNMNKSIKVTYVSTLVLVVSAFIIGRWIGIGLFVISFGMLALAIVLQIGYFVSIKMTRR